MCPCVLWVVPVQEDAALQAWLCCCCAGQVTGQEKLLTGAACGQAEHLQAGEIPAFQLPFKT